MKRIILIISLILFSFSIPTVRSIVKECYLPSWSGCPSGYECYEFLNGQDTPSGRKVGWEYGYISSSSSGSRKYIYRLPFDISLENRYTVSSKVYYSGNHKPVFSHPWYPCLDFGTPTSFIASCNTPSCSYSWKRVTNETLYSSSLGYGWSDITNLDSITRVPYFGDPYGCSVESDFVLSNTDHTFNIDVKNGNYKVIIVIGDMGVNSKKRDFIDVYAEGILKIDNLNYSFEELAKEKCYDWTKCLVSPSKITFDVNVNDGQLNLEFHDDGGSDSYWIVNGITIKNTDTPTELLEYGSSLDFNYSNPGPAYLFEPGYDPSGMYFEGALYENCGELLINFSQTDRLSVGVYIEYKTYILDFNQDNKIDILDAIILSNEYGQSWGSPGDAVDINDYTWRADINSDGIVNTLDATILKNQFGTNYTKPFYLGSEIWQPQWPS